MPLNCRVGSFAKSTAAAPAVQAITGVGFQPKALILICMADANANVTVNGFWPSIGFTAGATQSRSAGTRSRHNLTTPDTGRRFVAKALTIIDNANNALAECDLTSFDADGFTLTWTVNTSTAYNIGYIALGGADLTNTAVVEWAMPTAVGDKAVTGVGFQPDCVLHLHAGAAVTAVGGYNDGTLGLGAMTATGQWAQSYFSVDASAGTDTQRVQVTDGCVVGVTAGLVLAKKAAYKSMDAGGFTVNFSTAPATAGLVASLCLKGGAYKVGSHLKSTAAAPATDAVTGVGFQPRGGLLASHQAGADATPIAGSFLGWGAFSAAQVEFCSAYSDPDALSRSNVDQVFYNNAVFLKSQAVNLTTEAIGDLTAIGTDGFTITWSTNDAAATQILYLAVGDASAAVVPTVEDGWGIVPM